MEAVKSQDSQDRRKASLAYDKPICGKMSSSGFDTLDFVFTDFDAYRFTYTGGNLVIKLDANHPNIVFNLFKDDDCNPALNSFSQAALVERENLSFYTDLEILYNSDDLVEGSNYVITLTANGAGLECDDPPVSLEGKYRLLITEH